MITVKEFAEQQGCGESIIYRHIRQHRTELGENVQKVNRKTWLNEEAQIFIKNLMTKNAAIVYTGSPDAERVKALEEEIEHLKQEKEQLYIALNAAKDKIIEMQEENKQLLVSNTELKLLAENQQNKKPFWKFW